MTYYISNSGELYHHGIKGQKWGVRRYQNSDGSLTDAGKKRLNKYKESEIKKVMKRRANESSTESVSIARRTNALDKTARLYGIQSKQTVRQAMKLADVVAASRANDEIAKAEIEKIKKMKFSDFTAERAEVPKALVKDCVRGLAATAVGTIIKSPYVATETSSRSASDIKTDMRVNVKTQAEILAKSYTDALRNAVTYSADAPLIVGKKKK